MAAPKKSNSSVVTARAKKTIALPPGTLGFASITEPDNYDPEKPTLKMNYHLTPEAIAALIEDIKTKVYTEANLAKLAEEGVANGIKSMPAPQDAKAWLEAKLKEPKESARIQLPYIILSNKAFYKNRSGELVAREIACWDAKNAKLNLKRLRLGMGSILEPVVNGNLFFSKLIGFPQPSLKLVGVRVLKLERFGGGAAPADTDEDAIKEVLGEAFEYDDLDAYAAGAHDDAPEAGDDGASPEDQAKNLFGGA
jgi:hypothetical protein